MYSLKQAWLRLYGNPPTDDWEGKFMCTEADAAMTFLTNDIHGYLAAYTFTLVTAGWLTFIYNGREMTLHADDIFTYSPSMPITIVAASDDYRGICLMVDEHTTIETPSVHDLIYIAYQPIVQLRQPKQTLSHEVAERLAGKLHEMIGYIHSSHIYRSEILRMLYAVFLLDLQNVQDRTAAHRQVPKRTEEVFLAFMRLLPQHFADHHDIPFYASSLHITPAYLSRIVRQVTGRTVIDYINQMLAGEAAFLLGTTSLSVTQIACRLNFADTSSFSKFFTRLKGITPREYRTQKA